MNIFNYLSNLLFTKKQPVIQNIDQEGDYQPFLINRWCSMLNNTTANVINTTVNTFFPVFENKHDHYKFLHYILPRSRFTRINYIKKRKEHQTDSQEIIKKMAKRLELSHREINLYVNQTGLDIKKYEQTKQS